VNPSVTRIVRKRAGTENQPDVLASMQAPWNGFRGCADGALVFLQRCAAGAPVLWS